MTPIGTIREELIQKPEAIDIEAVGARLEHHNLSISVDNMFIDDTGDRRLVWDLREQAQVLEASQLFSGYLDKGWRAYAIDAEGNKRRRIRSFNAEKEEILFEELTSNEILTNFADKMKKDIPKPEVKTSKLSRFVEAFKQTLLVPRTYPG